MGLSSGPVGPSQEDSQDQEEESDDEDFDEAESGHSAEQQAEQPAPEPQPAAEPRQAGSRPSVKAGRWWWGQGRKGCRMLVAHKHARIVALVGLKSPNIASFPCGAVKGGVAS